MVELTRRVPLTGELQLTGTSNDVRDVVGDPCPPCPLVRDVAVGAARGTTLASCLTKQGGGGFRR